MVKVVKTRVEFEGRFRDEYTVVEGEQLEAWSPSGDLKVVGRAHPRLEGAAKVTGSAKYTHDIYFAGMVYGKFLRSPYAHARITSIDTSAADELPGVLGIYTYLNAHELGFKSAASVFSQEVVHQGDVVALVLAQRESVAEDALELIRVEYEPLKPLVDPEEIISSESSKDRVVGPRVYERGDVEEGFAEAEVVVEEEFRTQAALHNCMETHGSVALWEGDTLVVYTSTQSVFSVRSSLSEELGIPQSKIRVVSEFMGGGFGSKFDSGEHTLIAATASRILRRPVRIVLDRVEENLATGNRSQTVQWIKIGAKRDGRITAIQLRGLVNIGEDGWVADLGGPAKLMYSCPNLKVELYGVKTNLVSSTAFRAPGYVEGCFALESAIDELARKLGMDPLNLRMLNYATRDPVTNMEYSSKALKEAYLKGAELIGWNSQPRVVRDGSRIRAKGVAGAVWWGGGGPPAYAQVKVDSAGKVTVLTATQDIGTGTRTALAQIAAEELGVPISDVGVVLGDTLTELRSPGSGGSQTLASMGPAVRAAAHDAKNQLLEIASQVYDVPKDRLTIRDGSIIRGDGEKLCSVGELLANLGDFSVTGRGAREPNQEGYMVNTFAAQFAEVEVDTETGSVKVLRVVSVHDSGMVVNPLLFTSQVEGGVIMGLGYALWEGRLVDGQTGVVLNPNLNDYLVARCTDMGEIVAGYVEPQDTHTNSLGVKGIGEPPIIGVAPAVANAIREAIGVRLRELPFTPERVYCAIRGVRAPSTNAKYL
ncbi:MAG: xanthine dehydrogenase family protein molybdopterin-binding subunit [Thermoprotei archaeon]